MNSIKTITFETDWTILPNLVRLIIPFSEELLRKCFNNPRMLPALRYRYGLVGDGRLMSYQEAGKQCGISGVRVEQFQFSWVYKIRTCLSGETSNPKYSYSLYAPVPDELVKERNDLIDALKLQSALFTDWEAIQFFQNRYADHSIDTQDIPTINFLLEILEFSRLTSSRRLKNKNLRMTWVMDDGLDRHLFWKVRDKIGKIISRGISPLNVMQLANEINRGKEPGIDVELVKRVCATYRNIELIGEDIRILEI
jgi:hypothetical protein